MYQCNICEAIAASKSHRYYTFRVCVSSLIYPARKAPAPYYIVICGLPGFTIFLHMPHIWHDFRKEVIEHKICVSNFSATFVRNFSHSKKN